MIKVLKIATPATTTTTNNQGIAWRGKRTINVFNGLLSCMLHCVCTFSICDASTHYKYCENIVMSESESEREMEIEIIKWIDDIEIYTYILSSAFISFTHLIWRYTIGSSFFFFLSFSEYAHSVRELSHKISLSSFAHQCIYDSISLSLVLLFLFCCCLFRLKNSLCIEMNEWQLETYLTFTNGIMKYSAASVSNKKKSIDKKKKTPQQQLKSYMNIWVFWN